MGKKKRQRQDRLRWCQNESGGLGIEPCRGISELATVTLLVAPAFSGLDDRAIHLCDDCATRLKEHAEAMGYDVEID